MTIGRSFSVSSCVYLMFVAGLEFLLGMYEKYFHPNHSLLLTIKRHLIYIYGR